MAAVGQSQMQAIQWVQLPFHTGLPSTRWMLFMTQPSTHLPQEMHASDTRKALSFTNRGKNRPLTMPDISLPPIPAALVGKPRYHCPEVEE